jgi:hypothetical protein
MQATQFSDLGPAGEVHRRLARVFHPLDVAAYYGAAAAFFL